MAADYVWKPRTVEDSVDAGVHPAVAAMRLSGGAKPQLNLGKLGVDASRPDWGSNALGTALVENLGFLRHTKPDTPAWALAEEGLAPKAGKEKKAKKEKKEKKKKQKDKKKDKKKKKKDKKAKSSSSSSSKSSSSSSSSESKSKAKKAKKSRKEAKEAKEAKDAKRKDGGSDAEAPSGAAASGFGGGGGEGEEAPKRRREDGGEGAEAPAATAAAPEESAAPAPAAPAASSAATAWAASSESSPFPPVLEALERRDLTVLDEAVGLLAPGAHPDPQRAAIAGALGNLVKASVDPTGINRVAVARAGAIPPLVQLLRSPLPDCQLQAAFSLHNLTSKNADNKEAVVREGGVSPLLAVLRAGSTEAKSQVVGVLRNLSGGGITCKAAVEAAGTIPLVVAVMAKAGLFQPQVQANLAVVLYNLCKESADCKLQVAKGGAFHALVSLLGSGVSQAQQEAADTLRIVVTGSADYCAAAVSAGVAPVLGVAMGPAATPKLRQQAGLLKKELMRSGGPEVQKALK